MRNLFSRASIALSILLCPMIARAGCDLCAVYVAQQVNTFHPGQLTAGVSEQFTSAGQLQKNGDKIDNTLNQYMNSSVTQVFGRYDFTDSWAFQTNIPIISRSYRRAEDGKADKGDIAGIGDISMLGMYSPLHIEEGGDLFRVTLFGGLKMPTGSYQKLKEDLDPGHHEEEKEEPVEHHDEVNSDEDMHTKTSFRHGGVDHGPPSGVHGHGLSLGSGSWDILGGGNFFGRNGKWLTAGSMQYAFRNPGPFSYRYGNDFLCDIGFGRYLVLEDQHTVAVRFNMLGEVKDFDTFGGVEDRGSALTSLFLGPEINFTAGGNMFGLLAVDLPTIMNNTEVGVVPDYRIRASFMYRF